MKKLSLLFSFLTIFALFSVWVVPVVAAPGLDRGPLTKITFIHYARGHAKPPNVGGGKGGGQTKCYGFLASGAKWKTVEGYFINPNNADGMDYGFVETAFNAGVAEWEFYGGNIFGDGYVDTGALYQDGVMDGANVAAFGYYPDANVIAVTTVWGYFYGPPQTRELVEWDMLFNESFAWGNANVNPALMDLQNIATHELGHSAGLADLYETSCNQETMYGYGTEGEISKRDLNGGDITGISKLYSQ